MTPDHINPDAIASIDLDAIDETIRAELESFLDRNGAALAGLPWQLVEMALAPETNAGYRAAQRQIYESLSEAERDLYLERTANALRKSLSDRLRTAAVMQDAWKTLSGIGRSTLLSILEGI